MSKIGKVFDIVSEIQILKPEAEEDQDYNEDNESGLAGKGVVAIIATTMMAIP